MRSFLSILGAAALVSAALSGCGSKKPAAEAVAGECTSCHGGAAGSAPPRATTGATATSDRAVGAHQAHLQPGPFRRAIACQECHLVPRTVGAVGHTVDALGNKDLPPAEVVFGPLSRADGAQPTWDQTRCAGTYCHGATLHGGSNTSPLWTTVDGSQTACGTCHGVPPPAPHPASGTATTACAPCHPGTVLPDGAIDFAGGRHVDGVVQIGAAACTGCHGDATRTPAQIAPAPPLDTARNADTRFRGVGAHQKHLAGTTLRGPVPCAECHPVAEMLLGHQTGVVEMSWGPVARAGGAVPAWNPTAATCASTYCHGSTLRGGTTTSPVWTLVDGSQVRCTSCHGAPPPLPHAQDTACGGVQCHVGYTATTVNASIHIDGYLQIGDRTCTFCHGDRNRAAAINAAPPTDVAGNTSTGALGVGAHMAHLTGTALRAPIACTECHPPVTSTSHAQGAGLVVRFLWGPLATAGGAQPTWDRASARCSSGYCHGATLRGGTNTSPVWTRVDGSQDTCGTCHGNPPPAPHPGRADCNSCHPGFTPGVVNLATHMDGVVDVTAMSCSSCHGDANRAPATTQAAPPVDTLGNRTPASAGVGAHERHLAGGPLRGPLACTDCHAVPSVANHADGTAAPVFGPLAWTAGATPTFASTTLRCSGTYCHGGTLAGGTNKSPVWNQVDGTQAACGTCHGVPPPAPHSQSPTCAGCHPGYTATSVDPSQHVDGVVEALGSCTSCHGDPARAAAIASAPPVDTLGNTATTVVGVGAHQRHLLGGSIRPAIACTECHTVPADLSLHPDGARQVVFGPLARSAGAAPAWRTTSSSCASTYCHGGTLLGGTVAAPVWTRVDGTQVACTACHGLPPRSTAHASVAAGASCGPCHTGYTASTVDLSLHVNGVVEATGAGCTTCHGDATRPAATASAPPVDALGNTLTTFRGVGAHQAHLGGGTMRAGIACTECHAAPSGTHPSNAVEMAFGPLARGAGAVPSWNGTALTCSNYCHGATLAGGTDKTPVWTTVNGTQDACGTCHGAPPAAPHVQRTACGACHAGYSATAVNLAVHVDGTLQVAAMTCTSCHGDAARVLVTGADPQARSAPPIDTAGGSARTLRGVGAHLAHLNHGTGAIAAPFACAECHVVPSSQAHANGTAAVTFGTRATTGGVRPTWNGTSCANTYCHGNHTNGTNSTPVWTSTSPLPCTTCHPMPPATASHSKNHIDGNACSGCHIDTNATGTAITRPELHVNGRLDGGCLDCHSSLNP